MKYSFFLKITSFKNCFSALVIVLFVFAPFSSQGQVIEIKKGFGGHSFYENGELLSLKEVVKITEANPAAHDFTAKAKGQSVLAGVFGFAGGFCLGYVAGSAIFGDNKPSNDTYNYGPLFAGIALIGVSVPIAISANRNALRGVKLYNDCVQRQSSFLQLRCVMNGNGIGFCLKI